MQLSIQRLNWHNDVRGLSKLMRLLKLAGNRIDDWLQHEKEIYFDPICALDGISISWILYKSTCRFIKSPPCLSNITEPQPPRYEYGAHISFIRFLMGSKTSNVYFKFMIDFYL